MTSDNLPTDLCPISVVMLRASGLTCTAAQEARAVRAWQGLGGAAVWHPWTDPAAARSVPGRPRRRIRPHFRCACIPRRSLVRACRSKTAFRQQRTRSTSLPRMDLRRERGRFNAAAAQRGRVVFEGAGRCTTCHVGNLLTDANTRLHNPSEVVSEPEPNGVPSYASRSATKKYRTTPLRGLLRHPPTSTTESQRRWTPWSSSTMPERVSCSPRSRRPITSKTSSDYRRPGSLGRAQGNAPRSRK
jgi:hypothetical protein